MCMLTYNFNIHSAPGKSRALISYERYSQLQGIKDSYNNSDRGTIPTRASPKTTSEARKGENASVS